MKTFVLVIAMWGYTGTEWQYIGNQIVIDNNFTEEECEKIVESTDPHYENEYYRLSVECFFKGSET
tara:strand:+ start:701 stop:898 length:198 start_codon:yes stop_codon:yes gene_type:complete